MKTKSAKNGSSKSSSAKPTAKSKEDQVSKVTSHAELVATLKSVDEAKGQLKSYLIDAATIVQEEQLSRAEVVLSIMEARDVEKSTAESQYSRMKKLFTDPDTLEQLRNGEIDWNTARSRTTTPQNNKSAKVQKKNAEKAYAKAITTLVNSAKIQGIDLATLINTIKSAAKKGGLK